MRCPGSARNSAERCATASNESCVRAEQPVERLRTLRGKRAILGDHDEPWSTLSSTRRSPRRAPLAPACRAWTNLLQPMTLSKNVRAMKANGNALQHHEQGLQPPHPRRAPHSEYRLGQEQPQAEVVQRDGHRRSDDSPWDSRRPPAWPAVRRSRRASLICVSRPGRSARACRKNHGGHTVYGETARGSAASFCADRRPGQRGQGEGHRQAAVSSRFPPRQQRENRNVQREEREGDPVVSRGTSLEGGDARVHMI